MAASAGGVQDTPPKVLRVGTVSSSCFRATGISAQRLQYCRPPSAEPKTLLHPPPARQGSYPIPRRGAFPRQAPAFLPVPHTTMHSPGPPGLDPDAMDDLPSVPRLRRRPASPAPAPRTPPSAPPAAPPSSRWGNSRDTTKPEPKHGERRRRGAARRRTRSRSPSPPPVRRLGKRRARTIKVIDDDDDDDDEDIVQPQPTPKVQRSKPQSRFSKSKSRSQSKSQSLSPSESKSPAPSHFASQSRSASVSQTPSDNDADDKNELMAQLEKDNEDGPDSNSDNSLHGSRGKSGSVSGSASASGSTSARSTRLTSRQRALQGEKIELEYSKLESPKHKKRSAPKDDWTPGDEKDLQRQQRARMRQLVTEKRNKEKRAATVDKVLRGVTSKRKKMSLACEALADRRDSRLSNTGIPKGFIRYTSGVKGAIVAVSPEDALPQALSTGKVVSKYPPPCTRDPKTGKRVFI